MKKYFNVNFEFDHCILENVVSDVANIGKGYVCFVDSNSLVNSYISSEYTNVLNSSTINFCDGSYIALLLNRIYHTNFVPYPGPVFFEKFIYQEARHLILGNTKEVFNVVVQKMSRNGARIDNLYFVELPFQDVEDFNYTEIAKSVNLLQPNFIWVSLGAPKQEKFMFNLLPYLDNGIMLGVGAALNYFTGELKEIPRWIIKLHLVWLFRIYFEPRKQIMRCIQIFKYLPRLYSEEKLRYSKKKLQIDEVV